MKISQYTFLFKLDQEYYAYNTLSNALIEIDKESYDFLRKLKKSKSGFESCNFDNDIYKALKDNIIITENDADDFLTYKGIITRIRAQSDTMHLTIAPTMDCCFNCHYCFEEYKEKKYMSTDVMDNIIKYIEAQKELTGLRLTWFGGEPLMAITQMEEFYYKFKKIWADKSFASNIITTGYHINKAVALKMKELEIGSVQITIDGMKDSHNKIKYFDGCGDVFEIVLSNIELLNDLVPEIDIVVRVNLTKSNADDYAKLVHLFHTRYGNRKNINIAPAFVLDRGVSNTDGSSSDLFNHNERSDFVLELMKKHGILTNYIMYPQPFINECAIRNDKAISFDPEGYVYKCWEVIGNKKYSIGKMDENGSIGNINKTIFNRQAYGADPIEDLICSKCKYLPICSGGCPIQRIENEFEGKKNCCCTSYKGYLEEFLKIHIARKKIQSEERI